MNVGVLVGGGGGINWTKFGRIMCRVLTRRGNCSGRRELGRGTLEGGEAVLGRDNGEETGTEAEETRVGKSCL